MNRKPPLAAALALAAALLAACGSTAPLHYYTLTPKTAPAAQGAVSTAYAIDVQPPGIPAQADQPEISVRLGDDRIRLLETRHWAGPLPDELRNALAGELTRELGVSDLRALPRPATLPVYRVQLQLRRFDATLGGVVLLEGSYSLSRSGTPKASTEVQPLSCPVSASAPAGADVESVVRGYQQALADVAGKIVGSLRGLSGGGVGGCS